MGNALKLFLLIAALLFAAGVFFLFGGAILYSVELNFPNKIALLGVQLSLANWICFATAPVVAVAVASWRE